MANTVRPALTNVSMSSFGQTGAATAGNANSMFGEKAKAVTLQGPYNAQQSSGATTDVIGVWADYSTWDYTLSAAVDTNSTNLKDPV